MKTMPEKLFLGIDTSNYTTSVAVFDGGNAFQKKMLLPVKSGEAGLRQSDAVFHHTRQLPAVFRNLFSEYGNIVPSAIGVSARPRNPEGSYMPCFLCGKGLAESISAVYGTRVFETSHQVGHILSALYSAKKLDLRKKKFIAFHVSGGTTDCLLCEPDDEQIIKITEIATSLDLKAGQAVDRTGLMLGLQFPCGKELEKLALSAKGKVKGMKPTLKDGNCCLAGLENKCKKLIADGEPHEKVARYCLESVYLTIREMTKYALGKYGDLPLVYAGGVMSNSIIRKKITEEFDADFAEPEFSCDNAVGTAIFAYLSDLKEKV